VQFPVYVTLRQEGLGHSVNINFFLNFKLFVDCMKQRLRLFVQPFLRPEYWKQSLHCTSQEPTLGKILFLYCLQNTLYIDRVAKTILSPVSTYSTQLTCMKLITKLLLLRMITVRTKNVGIA
jgi:hypothetical protein